MMLGPVREEMTLIPPVLPNSPISYIEETGLTFVGIGTTTAD